MKKVKVPGKGSLSAHLIVILVIMVIASSALSCSGSKKAASAKPAEVVPEEVFVVVEQMRRFPGGNEALMMFIKDNLKYPEQAKTNKIIGRVVLRFVVRYDGKIGQVDVINSVDPLLDAEAVRVVKMLPEWQPGMQGGKPVNVWYHLPVVFNLSDEGKSIIQNPRPPRFIVEGNDTVYTSLTNYPKFPGGQEAMKTFRNANLNYPAEAKNAGFGGTVILNFIVDRDGKLSDFAIINGVSPSLDAEALRVARLMPPWIPGNINGRPVKALAGNSFNFELNPGAPPSEVFVVVEEMPKFPGSDSALMKFIYTNLQYPEEAKTKGIQGRVILRFCVNHLGNVEQIQVLKPVDPALDYEAIRVIKSLPQWIPGKQGGKPVNTWYSVPVTFSLQDKGQVQPQLPVNPAQAPPPPPVPQARPLIVGYDEPPVFPGGEAALAKFIELNKRYPQEAKEKNISGKVTIGFTISEAGTVIKPFVALTADRILDTEAMRVISLLPEWQPAKFKGKPVAIQYKIGFVF